MKQESVTAHLSRRNEVKDGSRPIFYVTDMTLRLFLPQRRLPPLGSCIVINRNSPSLTLKPQQGESFIAPRPQAYSPPKSQRDETIMAPDEIRGKHIPIPPPTLKGSTNYIASPTTKSPAPISINPYQMTYYVYQY
jgi:hypothetical protein